MSPVGRERGRVEARDEIDKAMNELTADPADLELLGYSPKWVEYGFLSPELLLAQVARFHTGADQSSEHFRYAAFMQLQGRDIFSDEVFQRYLELAALDPDPLGMARAALIELLDHPGITDAQWEAVLAHPLVQTLPKLIRKRRLLKALRGPNVTDEILWRCVEEGDGDLHRRLLDRPDLPGPIIEALHQKGANKAVRKLAGIHLKRVDYRTSR
jgi:hypothetical protein